jgi:hypothetical protein
LWDPDTELEASDPDKVSEMKVPLTVSKTLQKLVVQSFLYKKICCAKQCKTFKNSSGEPHHFCLVPDPTFLSVGS